MEKKWNFIPEILGGLGFFWGVNFLFFASNPGFIGINPHPYLFLVTLITTRYGYARGLAGAGLSSVSYLAAALVRGIPFDYALFAPAAYFLIFTTIIGILIDGFYKKDEKARAKIGYLTGAADKLKEEKDKLEDAHFELSQRLIAEKSTFSILYRVARKFNTLDKSVLMDGIIELVDAIIGAENCTVYFLEDHTLRLVKTKNNERGQEALLDQEIIGRVLKEKKTFSIKDSSRSFKGREVFIYGPLLEGSQGEPVGIIAVQGLDFLKYNPTSVSLFNLLCDWASMSLGNINTCQTGGGKSFVELKEEFSGFFPFGVSPETVKDVVDTLC